jgi:streptogrisin C
MQRRQIAVAAAIVVAAGTAVGFTLPSMAGTTPSGSTATPSTGRVSAKILAVMERDLGVDGDQAEARLLRSNWASGVSSRLAAETGADFGGAWLATDGTTLKIAVTDAAAASTVRAAGAVPVLVDRSEETLVTAKEKLDAAGTDTTGLSGWYVDVPTNKLVVVAKPGATASAAKLAREAGVSSDAVKVTTSTASPKPLADVRGADPYFIALDEGTARCSIGFSVEGGFVTAGHCGAPGDQTAGSNQQAMGAVQASIFPGDADEGFVKVNANFTPRAVVVANGVEVPVAGSTEAPVGAAICRSGSTTGTHCGTILAKNQTVVYPEGQVTGLTRTNVCAEAGDSGGPWLSGDQAQGVTSGGSGDCTVGGETFFQPINEILALNKLTLLTTGGDGGGGGASEPPASEPPSEEPPSEEPTDPPSEEPPSADPTPGPTDSAGACADQAVNRKGSLRHSGSAQVQPNGGAFRANAGTQTACLSAADGADFGVVLQRHTNRGFRTVASVAAGEELTFTGRSGTYRYVVVDVSGSGAYSLGFTTP